MPFGMTPNNPKDMYPDLEKEAIDIVKAGVKAGLWKNRDNPQKENEIMQDMVRKLAVFYEVSVPSVAMDGRIGYEYETEEIHVDKASLVTLLCGFRAHMHSCGCIPRYPGVDAHGWAVSMFAKACPLSFDKAWRENRIVGMPPHPDAVVESEF